jgi:hypothetical protein
MESRLRLNTFLVKRFYASSIDRKTGVKWSHDPLSSHSDGRLYVYTEAVPDVDSSNLYMCSIVSEKADKRGCSRFEAGTYLCGT